MAATPRQRLFVPSKRCCEAVRKAPNPVAMALLCCDVLCGNTSSLLRRELMFPLHFVFFEI